MMIERFLISKSVYLFTLLLIVGCTPTTSSIPVTSPATPTVAGGTDTTTNDLFATVETVTPKISPAFDEPDTTLTPTEEGSTLLLTFSSDRTCSNCLYGIASSLFEVEIDCIFEEAPCFSEPKLLFNWNGWITEAEWDKSGERIVFESEGNLFIGNKDGTNIFQIPSDPGSEFSPHWSKDNNQIAYIFGSDVEPTQIRIFDLETQQSERILSDIYAPRTLYWFQNGDMAVVSKESETDWTEVINIVGPDGTILKTLPENAAEFTQIGDLAFSPDLLKLAFVAEKSDSGESTTDIYLTNINGGEVENITGGLGYNFDPHWLPFGAWLAFSSNRTGDWDLYLFNIDDRQLQQVTNSEVDESLLAWRVSP